MKSRVLFLALFCAVLAPAAFAQANGKLQIHFIDVGQGDGAILISPQGQTALFDNGVLGNCEKPVSYLQQLGVTKIDYLFVSHYHSDHIGCTNDVLAAFPLQKQSIDRGESYNSATFNRYVQTVGTKRTKGTPGMVITLDEGSQSPVRIKVIALNGNTVQTDNENDRSLVATVKFGEFDVVIGGDLSGFKTANYEDIESSVAVSVGQVEVYKVHHHGSSYSSNQKWLQTIKPKIGIVSAGDGNGYGHPTQDCLDRLHAAGVKTYWTEHGNGVSPEPGSDIVAGNIIVQVAPSASTFTVTYGGANVDTYSMWGTSPSPETPLPTFAWSKKSTVYHLATCHFVNQIAPANLERGNTAPQGKTLHKNCPQ